MAAEDLDKDDKETRSKDDRRKIYVSRIPTTFKEESVQRILEEQLGPETVLEVTLIYKRPEDEQEHCDGDEKPKKSKKSSKEGEEEHRGFGFVTLNTDESYEKAIQLQTVRGGRKATSSRKHTLYLRPYAEKKQDSLVNGCYLWSQFRCPYGPDCKFVHEGKGGCLPETAETKKKPKCFAFKKGKCKRGDACPFSHDFAPSAAASTETDGNCIPKEKRPDSEKDCINWKSKGKCRKGDKCPYRHDEAVREAALAKKKRRHPDGTTADTGEEDGGSKKHKKERQPLWVRVFGMNYDTREDDIREFLQHCGTIVEIQFPLFEDSGRSKGYCGVLFQSPKAVSKAVELDGQELLGRWLRIQSGKMLLDQWEERETQHRQPGGGGGEVSKE